MARDFDGLPTHDYFAIELLGGHVFMLLNMGSGSIKVKATQRRIDNGLWHSIRVIRDGKSGRIFVDDYSVGFNAPGTSTELDLEGALFIGGVGTTGFLSTPSTALIPPPDLWSGNLGYGFVGCVKDVIINDDFSVNLSSYVVDQDTAGVRIGCNSSVGSHCPPYTCLNEGICLEGWNRHTCLCHSTGFSGPNCGRESPTLSFNGDQFWKATLSRLSVTQAEDIFIRFRTMRSSGLLFVATSSPSQTSSNMVNYIILSIDSSRLRVVLNLGEGNKINHVGFNLNDDLWHSVKIERRGPSLEIKLDGVNSVTEITGQLITLHINSIYLASLGVKEYDEHIKSLGSSPTSSLYHSVKDVPNFAGLIQSVVFNGHDLIESARAGQMDGLFKSTADLDVSTEKERLEYYAHHAVTFKSRKTFVALPQLRAYSRMSISFQFKTLSANGLILYNAGRRNHFICVELEQGHITYSFNMGDGGGRRLKSRSKSPLNDNQWHSVTIHRSTHNHHSLRVDDQVVTMTSPGINTHLHLTGLLYLGGVPSDTYESLPKLVKSTFGYEGCLASIDFNNELVDPSSSSQVVISSTLVSPGCMAFTSLEEKRCSLYSCTTKGVCVPYSPTTYACDCDESTFTGTSCSEEGVSFRFGPDSKGQQPEQLGGKTFPSGGGLITVQFPSKEGTGENHLDTKSDSVSLGVVTTQPNAVLLRVDSSTSSDFMELHIIDGNAGMVYNLGYEDHDITNPNVNISDGRYHVIRFDRNGQNATLQIDNHNPIHKNPPGKQLTIFNSLSKIQVGGKASALGPQVEVPQVDGGSQEIKIKRTNNFYNGIVSGLTFDGMKILDLAAEGDERITLEGGVQLMTSIPKQFNPKNVNFILNGTDRHRQKHRFSPHGIDSHHTRPVIDDSDELILSREGPQYCWDDDDCSLVVSATSTAAPFDDLITPFLTNKVLPSKGRDVSESPRKTKVVSCDKDEDDEDCQEGSGSPDDDDNDDNEKEDSEDDDDTAISSSPSTFTEWIPPFESSTIREPFFTSETYEFKPWTDSYPTPSTSVRYVFRTTSTTVDPRELEQTYRPKLPPPIVFKPTNRPFIVEIPKPQGKGDQVFGKETRMPGLHGGKTQQTQQGTSSMKNSHVTKSSLTNVDRTALVIGVIVTIILVIVFVAPIILFAKLRMIDVNAVPSVLSFGPPTNGCVATNGNITAHQTTKAYQFVPVAGAPAVVTHDGTVIHQTHIQGQVAGHSNGHMNQSIPYQYQPTTQQLVTMSAGQMTGPASILKKKKDSNEWYV